MWWECVVLHPFWFALHMVVAEIMRAKIPLQLKVFLLHDFRGLKSLRRDIFLAHMLMAASLLIAQNWNSTKIPSLYELRCRMHHMFFMFKLKTMLKVWNDVVHAQLIFQK